MACGRTLGVWYSQLALISLDALGGAEALARVGIAQRGMPIALACWGGGKETEVTTGFKDYYQRLFLKKIILSKLDLIGKTDSEYLMVKVLVFQLIIYLE